MLVALTAKGSDALAAKKGEGALHAADHRAAREVAPRLPVLLAVEDVCAECFNKFCGEFDFYPSIESVNGR